MSADLGVVLAAALDVMVPGDATFPAASAIDLAGRMLAVEAFAAPTRAAVALLPADFTTRDAKGRCHAVAALEAEAEAVFARFVTAAYSAYYSAQPTLEAVERASGYAARPPQPAGYALPPFDAALLAVPASRPPHYRTVPEVSTNAE